MSRALKDVCLSWRRGVSWTGGSRWDDTAAQFQEGHTQVTESGEWLGQLEFKKEMQIRAAYLTQHDLNSLTNFPRYSKPPQSDKHALSGNFAKLSATNSKENVFIFFIYFVVQIYYLCCVIKPFGCSQVSSVNLRFIKHNLFSHRQNSFTHFLWDQKLIWLRVHSH